MSYILDALRRADAERVRGEIPSVHAQHVTPLTSEDETDGRSRRPMWIIGGLSLALVAALGWSFLRPESPLRAEPPALDAPTAALAPGPGTPSAKVPSATPATPVAAGSAPTVAGAVPAPVPPSPTVPGATGTRAAGEAAAPTRRVAAKPASTAASKVASASRKHDRSIDENAAEPRRGTGPAGVASALPTPKTADTAATTSTRAPPGPDGDAAGARIYAERDLPDAVRRELPKIAVGGSTYSPNSASRMLMINGQIFHEGDAVIGGLVLQQIKPRTAVFAFKNYRYELPL